MAGKSYWLVKSEPSVYSIESLRKDTETLWDGVRNYQARNFLMAMKPGDQVLFYHSSCETPGIMGVAEVVATATPDETQFDKKSEYFDPKATRDQPRWFAPRLKYLSELNQPVYREELLQEPGLKDWELLKRGSRLSVIPATREQFTLIIKLSLKS